MTADIIELGYTNANMLIEKVIKYKNIKHIVMIITYKDDFVEVVYDRQHIIDVVFASKALEVVADELAQGSVVEDHGVVDD